MAFRSTACSNEVVALFVAPVCPPPTNACAITGLAYIADTGCNPATGTYDVRIEVAYTNAPTNGTLDVNGQAFPISASPQLVTLTGLPADGLPVDVFALFSADPACSNEVVALFMRDHQCFVYRRHRLRSAHRHLRRRY